MSGPRPRVVLGIAGGTASGKTTLAGLLARELGESCLVLYHDRYYLPLPAVFRSRPEEFNFDHPNALETTRLERDLDELLLGRAARVPVYDFGLHERLPTPEWVDVEPRPVILLEGILVLAEAGLRARCTHTVYVHAPADVRLIRRIRRDMAERGRSVHSILDQYERTVRPMHEQFVEPSRQGADLVVDGLAPADASVAALRALIGV